MRTAEVAVEHMLTGLLALCAFVLPFWEGGLPLVDSLTSPALVGVLGLAYPVGVIFDKVADVVLSPMEQWLRLYGVGTRSPTEDDASLDVDPFPQDVLEYNLRTEEHTRVEWMDSLRSRVRTCRGVAVLGAPASIGVASLVDTVGVGWPPIFAGLTLVLLLVAVGLGSVEGLKLRKTYEPEVERGDDRKKRRRGMAPYTGLLAMAAVYVMAQFYKSGIPAAPGLIAAGGLGLSVSALWAWWQITKTHMKFVQRTPRE